MSCSILNGTLKDKNEHNIRESGQPLHGISVCNVLVGCENYVKKYMPQKAANIDSQYKEISEMLDPAKWCHPEIPTRWMVWLLTVVCLHNLGDYWIRHTRPDWIEESEKNIDNNTDEILKLCTGVNMDSWSAYSQECMCLPMGMKDCGLR